VWPGGEDRGKVRNEGKKTRRKKQDERTKESQEAHKKAG
jgi:hypothetical protein